MAGSNQGGVTFQPWLSPGPSQAPGITPGAIVGSMPPQPWVRSVLDARRMMYNRTPEAEYPDGYLGTIVNRRGDKILDGLKARVNQKSYQRGVHLGERVDPGDYLWPDELTPFDGLKAQAQGKKWNQRMEYFQPTPSVDGSYAPRGATSVLTLDVHRASQLAMLRPRYGLPARQLSTQT
jgi:hypothetical protein